MDIISLLAGAGMALVLAIVIYTQRNRLATLRSSAAQGMIMARRRLGRGLDARYRDAVIKLANGWHLAGHLVPLERVAVIPRLYTLPQPHDPLEEEGHHTAYDGPLNLVPLTPDWPQAMGPYQIPGLRLDQALRSGDSVALLGLPGSGRSTTLALIALLVARQHEENQPGGLLAEKRLPILIHLADVNLRPEVYGEGTDPLQPLLDAAGSQLGGIVGASLSAIRRQFAGGAGLILCDAWDELPLPERLKAAEWLKLLMDTYPGNQYVVVGTPQGYKPLFDIGLTPVFVVPWGNAEYNELARLWAAAWPQIGSAGRGAAPQPEPDTVRAATRGLRSRSPLEAVLKIWAFFAKDDPGIGQIGWFRAYVDRSTGAPDLLGGLARIAQQWAMPTESPYFTMEQINRHVDAARKLVQRPSLGTPDLVFNAMQARILWEHGNGHITFWSPVIGAYLAAEALRDAEYHEWLLNEDPVNDLIMPFLAQTGNVAPYVYARLAEAETLLQHNMLMLGAWAADADVNAPWRNEIFKQLTALFLGPAEFPLVRERTMAALVAARDRNVAFIFRQGLTHFDSRIRTLSALGLGAMGDPEQLIHIGQAINDSDPWVETAAALALGALGTKAALNYMLQTFISGRDSARRAVGEMLATDINGEGHEILKEAMQEPDPQTRRAAVYGLQLVRANWAKELLVAAQNRDDQWMVRSTATSAIESLENLSVAIGKTRPRLPDKTDWLVVWLAERDQAIEPGPRAVSQMIRALQDGDEATRIAAAEALGGLTMPEAITPLYAALRDQNYSVRDAAYRALGRISHATGRSLPAVA